MEMHHKLAIPTPLMDIELIERKPVRAEVTAAQVQGKLP